MSFLNDKVPGYTRDRAEAILSQALHHIHPACIEEFLYPSQETHLQQLQQVLMQPRRQALNMSVSTVAASDAPPLNELLRCIIFPSFTIGSLSVMYHISEHVRSSISPHKSPYIARCVRDDQNGIYSVFADLDTGFTEVDIMILHSPAFREHITMTFRTAPLRVIMHNLAKRGVYDEQMVRHAVVFTARINQIRACPFCGRHSVACRCTLNLVRKRYSVDFTTDLTNLASYTGDYEGLCYQAVYADGVNLCTWTSRVGVTGRFLYDNDGIRKLESWAMWNTLQGRENLLKPAVPDVGADVQPTEYFGEVARGSDDNFDAIAERGDALAQGFTLHDIVTPSEVEIAQITAQSVPSDELSALGTNCVSMVPQVHSVPSQTVTIAAFDGIQAHDQLTTFPEAGISSLDHITAAEFQNNTQSINRTEPSQVPQLPHAVIESTTDPVHELQLAIHDEMSLAMERDAVVKPKRVGRPRTSTTRGVKQIVTIAPAAKTDTGCEEEELMPYSDEATRKQESRKAQKRESACRSHERKKNLIKTLKDDLAEAKTSEAMLRREQQELKEENLALRAKLED